MIVPVRKLFRHYVHYKKAIGKLEGGIVILQSLETVFSFFAHFLKILFLLEDNCFTILWFLSPTNMNQPRYTYIPSLLNPSFTSRPIPPL